MVPTSRWPKRSSLHALVAIALFAGAGCAAPADASTGDDQNVTANRADRAAGTTPITLANWTTHPTIVAIRAVVDAVDASPLTTERKNLCDGAGHGEFVRQKSTDPEGRIRRYLSGAGGEDSAENTTYYYDAAGKLTFVIQTLKDVHGSSAESRVYLDASGKRVWEVFRHANDPDLKPDLSKAPFETPEAPIDLAPDLADPGKMFGAAPFCD